jgi:oxalate decarboxylase/phosphoglucose isomerase-like protein (cupin superfamily)
VKNIEMIAKHFDKPDQVRVVEKGRFELVSVNGQTFGRAIYEPGWKWSVHVGPQRGSRWCLVEHLVYVISGASAIAFEDGRVVELKAGTLFYVPPVAHDSWVIGDAPYMSLHLLGAEGYVI